MDLRIAQKYDISEDIVWFNRQNFELEVDMVDLSSQTDAETIDHLPQDATDFESTKDSSQSECDINFDDRELDVSSTDDEEEEVEMQVDAVTRPTEQGEIN